MRVILNLVQDDLFFIKSPFPLSSPRNLVGDLSFHKRTTTTNNGFPTTTLGNDGNGNTQRQIPDKNTPG